MVLLLIMLLLLLLLLQGRSATLVDVVDGGADSRRSSVAVDVVYAGTRLPRSLHVSLVLG